MGSSTFGIKAKGASAEKAFRAAREWALHEYGHGGYTGSIAEKDTFIMITKPATGDPLVYANDLLQNDDPRISDKWGPAGCLWLGNDEWYFFGWASD